MASPEPLRPYRQVQANAEKDAKGILEQTAKAIQRRVAMLGTGRGAEIRKAQLTATLAAVRRAQRAMWRGPLNATIQKAVEDAEKAGEDAVEAMTRAAYGALPKDAAKALVDGLRASAASGLTSDRARKRRELSRMVYRQEAFHSDRLERTIREGIISNLSAKELAATAYQYVSPTAKGGASYAAMRLARTEINNALHERQIAGARRPGVTAVVWNLSGSHRVPDECNVYAAKGGNGQWPVLSIPDKPHPQCFCYLTYVTAPPEEFKKRLEAGSFDDEIERRTRENMARLGQKVGNIEPPKAKPAKRTTPRKTAPTPADAPSPFTPGKGDPTPFTPVAVPDAKKVKPVKPASLKMPGGRVEAKGPLPEAVRRLMFKVDSKVPKRIREAFQRTAHIQHNQVGDVIDARIAGVKMGMPEGMRNADAAFTYDSREMSLSGALLKREDRLVQAHACGWHPPAGEDVVESTIAHECGHALAASYRMTRDMCADLMATAAKVLDLPLAVPDVSDLGWREAQQAMEFWFLDRKNRPAIRDEVSEYAASSVNEFIAEVWRSYTMSPNPSPEIKALGDLLKAYIIKEKKGLLGI